MKLKDIQTIFHEELDALFGENEVSSFFNILIKHHYDLERITLVLEPDFILSKADEQPLFHALSRLKNEEPIQYIIGKTEFLGMPFKVNKYTLIPRPETEELVTFIMNSVSSRTVDRPIKIIDIGTGSGCIAITLAKKVKNAEVYALDISEEALIMAKENAELNNVDVKFIKDDILNVLQAEHVLESHKFDIVVSNPPYVRELEKKEIKNNVLSYEPHLALFVQNEDPLIFYKAISKFAVDNLTDNGIMFFEINQYLGNQMTELLEDFGFNNVELLQDLFGNDRFIKASISI